MLLWEIITGMKPLSFEWLDDSHARFSCGSLYYGILIENKTLLIGGRDLKISNVVFGVLESSNGIFQSEDLSLKATNAGNIREILATVARAVTKNKYVLNRDLILLAAGDELKEKRFHVYSLAAADIIGEIPEFSEVYPVIAGGGSKLIGISKIKFSEEELILLGQILNIPK